MTDELTGHAPNCDWHTDHYPWECTCGFNKTKDTAAEWQSGYDAAIESCIAAIENQKASFASEQYAVGQPLSSFLERFACDQCIDAITALKKPVKETPFS